MSIEVTASINIKDLEALARRLDVVPALIDGVEAAGIYVKGVIAEYPPSSEANLPGPYPKTWYVRGTGPYWALAGGGFHFKKTSETLGRRAGASGDGSWASRKMDNGLTIVVGNNASYAPFVHDATKQAKFHARRGWKTVQAVAQDEAAHVREIIADFIHAAIERKRG